MAKGNNIYRQYINNIKRLLPIYRNSEKKFICVLQSAVCEFSENEDCVTYDALVEKFGEPTAVVAEYLEALDSDELQARIRSSRYTKTAAVVFLILITCCASLFSYVIYKSKEKSDNAEIVTELTVITTTADENIIETNGEN